MAFGVGQSTINQVQAILEPQNAPVEQSSPVIDTSPVPTTQTPTQPSFGSVQAPCVDAPVFTFVPNMTTVPYGQSAYFSGGVQDLCSGAYLPYGQWTVQGNVNVDGNLRTASDYSNYFFGETNNGTHATTTSIITFTAMGVSTSTSLILAPSI